MSEQKQKVEKCATEIVKFLQERNIDVITFRHYHFGDTSIYIDRKIISDSVAEELKEIIAKYYHGTSLTFKLERISIRFEIGSSILGRNLQSYVMNLLCSNKHLYIESKLSWQ